MEKLVIVRSGMKFEVYVNEEKRTTFGRFMGNMVTFGCCGTIKFPSVKMLEAKTVCVEDDLFCKERGIAIVIGRILGNIKSFISEQAIKIRNKLRQEEARIYDMFENITFSLASDVDFALRTKPAKKFAKKKVTKKGK